MDTATVFKEDQEILSQKEGCRIRNDYKENSDKGGQLDSAYPPMARKNRKCWECYLIVYQQIL